MARKSRLAGLIATAVTAVTLASAAPAGAQPPVAQDGLVNVNIQDVEVLVPVSVAANICDLNVGILARQERTTGAECDATARSIASPGASDGGGPVSQEGLVNVNIQDLEVFVPVSIAANLCDINVGVLAEQLREGGATCDATARSLATRGPGPGGGAR
jgi:hypothetical protein